MGNVKITIPPEGDPEASRAKKNVDKVFWKNETSGDIELQFPQSFLEGIPDGGRLPCTDGKSTRARTAIREGSFQYKIDDAPKGGPKRKAIRTGTIDIG